MDEIDVKKLEKCLIDTSAELRASHRVIDILQAENQHLRELIHIILDSHGKNSQ